VDPQPVGHCDGGVGDGLARKFGALRPRGLGALHRRQRGHQIRSGQVGAAPFVWKAVASTKAPSGFESGKAVLNVYQPRKGTYPGEWSGKQLTAASTYSNASHPMAAGTGRDPALVDFVSVFQPTWDGLVQLRMYFTAPGRPQHSIPYPATVIQVKGDTWTQIGGGDVPCNAGTARSAEELALPSSILNRPTARSTPGAPGAPTTGRSGTAHKSATSTTSPGGSTSTGGTAGSDSSLSAAAANQTRASRGSGNTGGILFALIAAAVAAGVAVAAVIRRRRIGATHQRPQERLHD
jgi:hypothetical protein